VQEAQPVRGPRLVEYGLIVTLIVLVAIIALTLFERQIAEVLWTIEREIAG
jgi:Flp pilus assembly pilin Flp